MGKKTVQKGQHEMFLSSLHLSEDEVYNSPIEGKDQMPKMKYKSISLFSGAMGMDLGLEQAGFKAAVCVEVENVCCETIRANRKDLPLINKDIRRVSTQEILHTAKLVPSEADLVVGGPPCQSFSTAGKRGSIGDPRGTLFREFVRIVDEARPKYFLMENVKGMLSAAIKHRPLHLRKNGKPLEPEEMFGSAIKIIISEFHRIGYKINGPRLLNAANYGVPQMRERIFFIGAREGEAPEFPLSTHSENGPQGLKKWVTLKQAFMGLEEKKIEYIGYSKARSEIYKDIPEGGHWRDLNAPLQKKALGGAYESSGGRMGFYRRLSFSRPAPTLPTSPIQKATGLCHPKFLRPLTVGEYARIQQFPPHWQFAGSISEKYKQIGNAVPTGLAKAVGLMIAQKLDEGKNKKKACKYEKILVEAVA